MSQVISNNPLYSTAVNGPNDEYKPYHVLFNASSTNLTSHTIEVSQTAIVMRVFGLTGGQTITINNISNDGITNHSTPMIINSKMVQLTATNNVLVIDIPGKYTATLSGGLGSVSCVWYYSGMSYWSYGLSDFAMA